MREIVHVLKKKDMEKEWVEEPKDQLKKKREAKSRLTRKKKSLMKQEAMMIKVWMLRTAIKATRWHLNLLRLTMV